MESFKDIAGRIVKYFANPLALGLVALAVSVFLFSVSLANFTFELRLVRRDMPKTLDRIDRQIIDVQKLMKLAESTGQDFQAGVNKGMSKGIVEMPLDTIANVGYKLSDTAANTGKQTISFWEGLKGKLLFWQKKKAATAEASPKK